MKAVRVVGLGDNGRLEWADHEKPVCGKEDVLIRVMATALNRADLLQRRGLYPPPRGDSSILGLECSGIVARTGSQVTRFKEGDRVCALLSGGGYAEYVAVSHHQVMSLDPVLTYEEGAAIPEAFLTAYLNLITLGRLTAGESVLIHTGASGVGTAAIQMAALIQATVITTAGDGIKCERCVALGARYAVNYRTDNFKERVLQTTDGLGVDLILDTVGASYLSDNLLILKPNARLVMIGLLGGHRADIDLNIVLIRNLRIMGSTLRPKSPEEKGKLVREFVREMMPHLREGRLRPVIDTVFDIRDVEEAHRRMAANQAIGKIVLRLPLRGCA